MMGNLGEFGGIWGNVRGDLWEFGEIGGGIK